MKLLEERRGDVKEVLTVLDAVSVGLQRYPTCWVVPQAAAAAAQDTHTRLKAASGVLDELPSLLAKAGIETPTVEITKLRECIRRTHRAAGRARSNAGKKSREKDDEKNQLRLQERFFWLEQLQALRATLLKAGDARPVLDEQAMIELESEMEWKVMGKLHENYQKTMQENERLRRELQELREQQAQAPTPTPAPAQRVGSMNQRLEGIRIGLAMSTVADAYLMLRRGKLAWDGGKADGQLVWKAGDAERKRWGVGVVEYDNMLAALQSAKTGEDFEQAYEQMIARLMGKEKPTPAPAPVPTPMPRPPTEEDLRQAMEKLHNATIERRQPPAPKQEQQEEQPEMRPRLR